MPRIFFAQSYSPKLRRAGQRSALIASKNNSGTAIRRTPKPGGIRHVPLSREASWSTAALCHFSASLPSPADTFVGSRIDTVSCLRGHVPVLFLSLLFMELNNDEIRRYSRHLILPEVGLGGQKKICSTSVLCIGAGGLGSPIAMYLAAAGIGKLGIVDFDVVDYSNLQRQILHTDADVGRPKSQSAKETINAINPGVEVVIHHTRLTSENAIQIISPYDIVVDGTDNFPTRYLTNDACVLLKKPNVYGSIFPDRK